MKILFVGNTSWSMWNFRKDVMADFKSAGWDVTVIAPKDDTTQKIEALGFKYIPIKNLDRKGINPIKDAKLFIEFVKIFASEKPSLIFQYTIKPNIWGTLAAAVLRITWLTRATSISMVSGLGYVFIRKTWLTTFVAALYKFAFLFAEKVIFLNKDDMQDFFRFKILAKSKAVLMAGEGVDTNHFKPMNSLDKSCTPPPSNTTFLFVGRLLIDKGVREFVEAARVIKSEQPDCKFQILGGIDKGNPAAISEVELQSWIDEQVISYLGTAEDVRPYFENATAIVLPSYLEGMSRVLMEALAMAKPIIATDVRGCRELVEPGKNGFLVQPGDSQSLSQAFKTILELPQHEIQSLAHFSLEKSRKFAISETIAVYRELTRTARGAEA